MYRCRCDSSVGAFFADPLGFRFSIVNASPNGSSSLDSQPSAVANFANVSTSGVRPFSQCPIELWVLTHLRAMRTTMSLEFALYLKFAAIVCDIKANGINGLVAYQ